jgi:hypothetical protein
MTLQREFVYLACPYVHKDDAIQYRRFMKATEAAAALLKQGHLVYSPLTHGRPMAIQSGLPHGWQFWQRLDRAYIRHSSLLFVLPLAGWLSSTGVQAEIAYAREIGIECLLLDPITFAPLWDQSVDTCSDSWNWCERCETYHAQDYECEPGPNFCECGQTLDEDGICADCGMGFGMGFDDPPKCRCGQELDEIDLRDGVCPACSRGIAYTRTEG